MNISSKNIDRRDLLLETEKMASSVLEDYNPQIECLDVLESLFVFGSVGADRADRNSDLDLLVVLSDDYASRFDSQERSKDFLREFETYMNMWPSILSQLPHPTSLIEQVDSVDRGWGLRSVGRVLL